MNAENNISSLSRQTFGSSPEGQQNFVSSAFGSNQGTQLTHRGSNSQSNLKDVAELVDDSRWQNQVSSNLIPHRTSPSREEDEELRGQVDPDVQREDHGGVIEVQYCNNVWVYVYSVLPWKQLSRILGYLANIQLPQPVAGCLVWIYAKAFSCNLEEADPSSVWQYSSIGNFFRRQLLSGCRPININSVLVSPADGTLCFRGAYRGGSLEQVKGVYYSLYTFLNRRQDLKVHKNTQLYQVVVYLCPGDYHGFHSPTRWQCSRVTHVSGQLMSVAPLLMRRVIGLLHLNERVVLEGQWRHGYFSMVAVGATNVGSIQIQLNPDLITNTSGQPQVSTWNCSTPVNFNPGEKVGQFSLGSTIVLIFEGPADLEERNSSIQ